MAILFGKREALCHPRKNGQDQDNAAPTGGLALKIRNALKRKV